MKPVLICSMCASKVLKLGPDYIMMKDGTRGLICKVCSWKKIQPRGEK